MLWKELCGTAIQYSLISWGYKAWVGRMIIETFMVFFYCTKVHISFIIYSRKWGESEPWMLLNNSLLNWKVSIPLVLTSNSSVDFMCVKTPSAIQDFNVGKNIITMEMWGKSGIRLKKMLTIFFGGGQRRKVVDDRGFVHPSLLQPNQSCDRNIEQKTRRVTWDTDDSTITRKRNN